MNKRRLTHTLLSIFFLISNHVLIAQFNRQTDSLALVALYNSTNGTNWTNKWTLTQPMTTWYGVTLTNGRVTCLDLDGTPNCTFAYATGNNLQGTLPTAVTDLQELQSLFLGNNKLTGTIPSLNLPKLSNLYCFSNLLSGNIPTLTLPSLVAISLGNNQLSGTIPDFNFPLLRVLNLYTNKFTGALPNFSSLTNLRYMDISNNQLSGTIPNFNLSSLDTLALGNNQLSGTIPNFSSLTSLKYLSLSTNQLSGTIPNFNLPNLQILRLSINQLSGTIPNFNLPKLTLLHFYQNQLDSCVTFTNMPLLNKDTLRNHNNKLTFDDILPNLGTLKNRPSIYSPQDSIYKDTTLQNTEGGSLTIDLGIDAAITSNVHKWYKNNVLVDSIVGSNKRTFNPLRLTDAGVWTCRITNSNAPLLTLYSRKITIVVTSSCSQRDSLALIDLYNVTGGANWIVRDTNGQKSPWVLSQPIKTWFGIRTNVNGCVSCIDLDGIADCKSSVTVVSGNVYYPNGNNLTGSLPRSMDSLQDLSTIIISNNKQLTGTIPVELFKLSLLTSIDLSKNNLNGSIPANTASLINLRTLRLEGNKLSGTIPTQVGLLRKLTDLTLSNNLLLGDIPKSIGDLTELSYLQLNDNQLQNAIPSEIGNLTKLNVLGLHYNKLTGSIPVSLQSLSQLFNFSIQNNQITFLPDLTNINAFTTNRGNFNTNSNRLTFSDVIRNLAIFSINRGASYTPQDSIYKDTTLQNTEGGSLTIDLGIDAAITSNVYKWYKNNVLVDSIVGSNKRTFNPLRLTDAGIWTCRITNPNAPLLTLYSRKITILVNSSCRQRDSLALIDLYNATNGANWTNKWDLTKPYNTWYGIQVDANGCVTHIDLNRNNLNGTLFPSVISLSNLESLSASQNNLTGIIPEDIGNMTNLKSLFLWNNKISGSIPLNISKLNKLIDLALGTNQLTGSIPIGIGQLINLTNLGLYDNKLTGNIPNEIGNLVNLAVLNLENNQLSGDIPVTLGNLTKCLSLGLGSNRLTGNIPVALGNLVRCDNLSLRYNQLTGTLPKSLANLINMKSFWIENNQLEGEIPQEYNSMTKLTDFTASNNKLTGEVPSYFRNFPLKGLNLQVNRFTKLPNLSNITTWQYSYVSNHSSYGLKVGGNRLTFESVLPNMPIFNTGNQSFYAFQDSIYKDTTLQNTEGGSLTIDLGIDAAITSNVYKWYKNNVFVDSIVGSNKRTFNPLRLTDAGVWTCRITNPNAPLLTLYSRKITIVVASSCRSRDSLALVALYNATGGVNWNRKDNWLTNNPINTWYGIQTNAGGCVSQINLDTDANNNRIDETGNNLIDSLPRIALDSLKDLSWLNLSGNRLTGTIPNFNLPKLNQLILRYNRFSGTIPNFSSLPNINQIDFFSNRLTGKIPNFNLPTLISLHLGNNQLDDTIPNFNNLPLLGYLYLHGNKLTGSIPNFNKIPNLLWFSAGGNKLTGSIPLLNLPKLETLSVGNNQINGTINDLNLPKLKVLIFDLNKISKVEKMTISPLDSSFFAQSNQLTFESILPNINRSRYIGYQLQDSIYKDTTIIATIGNTINVNLGIDGAIPDNNYKWFKNGQYLRDTNKNVLVLRGVKETDAGVYTCQVTNPNAPLLTLYSRKITVRFSCTASMQTVNASICPAQNYRLSGGGTATTAGVYRDTLKSTGGCDSIVITNLSVYSTLSVSIANLPTVACRNQTTAIALAGTPTGGTFQVNGATATTLTPSVLGIGTHTVNYSYRDNNGCTTQATQTLRVGDATTSTLNRTLCFGDSLTINGKIFHKNRLTDTTILRGVSSGGCDSIVTVRITLLPTPTAKDDSYTLTGGQTNMELHVLANDNVSDKTKATVKAIKSPTIGVLTYKGSGIFSYKPPPFLTGNIDFSYQVCETACPTACATANVVLANTGLITQEIPLGITPNGDGVNDELVFDVLNTTPLKYPQNEIVIANRWGQVVYKAKPYSNDWKGTNQTGQPLPAGTYYYIMRLDINEGKVITGDITVIR